MTQTTVSPPSTPHAPSSTRRARSPPTSPSSKSPPSKRQRATMTSAIDIKHAVVPSAAALPDALKLIKAMESTYMLEAIGYCPTQSDKMCNHMLRDGPDELTKDDVSVTANDPSSMPRRRMDEDRLREERNKGIVAEIGKIHAQHAHSAASGYLDKPFALRVARKGCEFDGSIAPPTEFDRWGKPDHTKAQRTALEARLKQWYDHAGVSGYGDVHEQVTKIDDKVRLAREIPASEFSVEPELLEHIGELWDKNFFPNTGTRVEPYKIHLYGPGGHFSVHRDTPQKDLVGTFLLGLGDTTRWSGGLHVEDKKYPAHEAFWCAFYPDVPHRVEKVSEGYRAVVAFKLFRVCTTGGETTTSSQVRNQVSQLIGKMEAPFGIMLERKYCLGTTQFNGFDALLLDSALSLGGGVDVRHLPVVLKAHSEWGSHAKDPWEEYEMSCETSIYPFTRGHADALVQSFGEMTRRSEPQAGPESHTYCGCPWLEGVTGVPFFSFNLDQSLYTYKHDEEETCNYVGNEAQAWREDSVYLSYTLLVLPSKSAAQSDDVDAETS